MKDDCADCEMFRRERAAQIRTGEGDLGDLLVRLALHEAGAHRRPALIPHDQNLIRRNQKENE